MADTTEARKKGLEDIIAGESAICYIDGHEGRLIYRGYDIHDLVNGGFEETAYLLLKGALPTQAELADFRAQIDAELTVPAPVIDYIKSLPPDANPMEALRASASALSFYDPEANVNTPEANFGKAVRLLARFPSLVAGFHRLRTGHDFPTAQPGKSIAENFLTMLFGRQPQADHVHVLDTALILHADHEFNASTFTARVIAATLSDMYSAVTGAIGALKGPLHGGANEQVMRMLLQIGQEDKAEEWITQALAAKKKIMGFGHRVYKTEDPRATHLRRMSEQLCTQAGMPQWYGISKIVERVVHQTKGLYPNVDFYSASTYYAMEIPVDIYTPIFAVSRISGWTAHIMEQHADNRLIRPASDYTGQLNLTYTPIEAR